MRHYVYRITCHHPQAVEKYYYGVRRAPLLPHQDTNYWSSSRYVKHAMETFGREWFTKKIISCYNTSTEAYAKEIRLHKYFDVKTHPLFFNRANQTTLKFSREGVRCSPETIEKIIRQVRGRVYSPEVLAKRAARRGEKRSFETRLNMAQSQKGKTISEETRQKMSEAHQGKTQSPETRQKIGTANRAKRLGTSLSEETRAKLSASGRKRTHSLETRTKMSQARRGRVVSAETREKIASSQRARHALNALKKLEQDAGQNTEKNEKSE